MKNIFSYILAFLPLIYLVGIFSLIITSLICRLFDNSNNNIDTKFDTDKLIDDNENIYAKYYKDYRSDYNED